MAIANTAHGNTKSSATAGTSSGAIATTAAVGECIIVAVCTVNTATSTPTDTASNTYQQLGVAVVNTDRVILYGCLHNKSANPSITCTFTSSRYSVAISTFTGVVAFVPSNSTTAPTPAHVERTCLHKQTRAPWADLQPLVVAH